MKFRNSEFCSSLLLGLLMSLICCGLAAAQSGTNVATAAPIVPRLVQFSGTSKNVDTSTASRMTGVTFALYRDQEGGAPLWLETQSVSLDAAGRYQVMLGSTKSEGLPAELFVSGEARWLGVQFAGQPEQPRVLLLSVPYALKAADAETLGGFPLSAFVLNLPTSRSGGINLPGTTTKAALPPALTGSGTADYIPLWSSSTALGQSVLFQSGTGTTAKIGIGNTVPAATLDVTGGATIRGLLNLPNAGSATTTAGTNSRPLGLVASSYNSSTKAAANQVFHWQAEPTGNNTASPSATLNLLFATAPAAAAETGLKINSKGLITFAPGQTFPGGSGTITGVTAGTGLTGGGTSGAVTLSLDTTKVPELGSSNNFTAPQQFTGNAGFGIAPSGTGYTPLTVGGATTFGTWFAITNTSSGGHTWNIISAGSGNAEGAGNLGITDLTGKSTIWLEGNTNTNNLTASGSAGGAVVDADVQGKNAGANIPGLRFGGASSGEGIASNRVSGPNAFGLQLFTEFVPRLSILQNGLVGIGATNPIAQLEVDSGANTRPAILVRGGPTPTGSNQNGGDGLDAQGSAGDLTGSFTIGGVGVSGTGGLGSVEGGDGGVFTGGPSSSSNSTGAGNGLNAFPGAEATGNFAPFAAYFHGNLATTGAINGSSNLTALDHPLDPANKYLVHAAVESSEMMNVYSGNAVTDANGNAVVAMPEWFEAVNRDFRYQLTVVGQFAQAIIASKISGNKFAIRTDKPNVEVSWHVTGIRQDAWANAHRVSAEVEKTGVERGHYLHPELFGAPEESSIEWARQPQLMKRLKEHRLKAEQTAKLAAAGSAR